MIGTLHDLDKPALVEILTTPKNAISRQYQRMFDYENVKLRFTDDALEAIADLAIQRKIGARGLRMIIEDLMLDLMYNLPSMKKVQGVRGHAGGRAGPGEADHPHREGRIAWHRASPEGHAAGALAPLAPAFSMLGAHKEEPT